MISLDSYYTNNNAPEGGVFFLSLSSLKTSQCYYSNNTGQSDRSSYCACSELSQVCTTVSIGDYYMNNVAQAGGAIRALTCNVIATNDYYPDNYADRFGAAMSNQQGTVSISRTSFYNNNAATGGAIGIGYSSLSISHSHFTNNTAIHGGAIYCDNTSLSILHSNYTSNQARQGGAVNIIGGVPMICSYSYFVTNIALLAGRTILLRVRTLFVQAVVSKKIKQEIRVE